MHKAGCQAWAGLGVALALFSALAGGCVRPPASDPVKTELLRQIREAYLFDMDVSGFERLSVPEVVARLDPDTRLVEMRRMSLDFIRGFEPEGSVVAVQELGSGHGYLRLVFFGRRTLADVWQALNGFSPPLDTLTIDLRDNAGGSFEQALRLAEVFLPPGVPLAIYEDREGRALRYATGTATPGTADALDPCWHSEQRRALCRGAAVAPPRRALWLAYRREAHRATRRATGTRDISCS